MNSARVTISLAVALACFAWAPASAAETRIVQNDAPVSLTNCEAFTEKVVVTWRGKVVPFGKLSPFDVDDRNKTETAMHLGSNFTNTSDSTATAVRVTFAGYDSFGSRVASGSTTYTGDFGPGALIERTKSGAFETAESDWQGNIATVQCGIDAVALANGTTWRANSAPPPPSTQNAAPVASPAPVGVRTPSSMTEAQRIGAMFDTLDLSETQKAQIRILVANGMAQNRNVTDPQQRDATIKATMQKVLAVLTPSQTDQLRAELAAAKQ